MNGMDASDYQEVQAIRFTTRNGVFFWKTEYNGQVWGEGGFKTLEEAQAGAGKWLSDPMRLEPA